jgi:hypothetical protein
MVAGREIPRTGRRRLSLCCRRTGPLADARPRRRPRFLRLRSGQALRPAKQNAGDKRVEI